MRTVWKLKEPRVGQHMRSFSLPVQFMKRLAHGYISVLKLVSDLSTFRRRRIVYMMVSSSLLKSECRIQEAGRGDRVACCRHWISMDFPKSSLSKFKRKVYVDSIKAALCALQESGESSGKGLLTRRFWALMTCQSYCKRSSVRAIEIIKSICKVSPLEDKG